MYALKLHGFNTKQCKQVNSSAFCIVKACKAPKHCIFHAQLIFTCKFVSTVELYYFEGQVTPQEFLVQQGILILLQISDYMI